MRTAYKWLGYLIAAGVALQAATIAFAAFGLFKWVDDGGTLDKAVLEAEEAPEFTGALGFMLHFMVGQMVIPLLAIALLVIAFFAKVPGGAKWAGFVLLAVVVQIMLGMFAHGAPMLGLLHGLNALILFSLAMLAARRVGISPEVKQERTAALV
jgi:hypothetical protein